MGQMESHPGFPRRILQNYRQFELTHTRNLSKSIGTVPEQWKQANICAIHEKGKKIKPVKLQAHITYLYDIKAV